MSDINTEIVDSATSTVDTTTQNDTTSQPSDEQLKAEIAKWKAIAERKTKQLESISKATQETPEANAPVQEAVKPSAGQEIKGDDRIDAIEFKIAHPELDMEDIQVVMKVSKMEGVSLNDALNNPLVKNNLEYKKQQNINSQATLSQTRGTQYVEEKNEVSRINALPEQERTKAILELLSQTPIK